jgi:tripartite-type tricarboxylate transporter receptor subunit TctC
VRFGVKQLTIMLIAFSVMACAQNYPNRPIVLIVPWHAGGGTDTTARIIGELLEKELKQPVNVVNRIGPSDDVGFAAIAQADADGYTIGMITVEIAMLHWRGLTDLKGSSYTPLGLMNADAAGVYVRTGSPYKNVKELLNAIRTNPGTIKASGVEQGGIWHLALVGLLKEQKIDPASVPWVSSPGAPAGLHNLIAGGVDFVVCSLREARSFIDAGKIKSLAIMDANSPALYPDLPTLNASIGSNWTLAYWRGVAGPKGMPVHAQARLATALKNVYDSTEYKDYLERRGYGLKYLEPAEYASFMEKSSNDFGAMMEEIGVTR